MWCMFKYVDGIDVPGHVIKNACDTGKSVQHRNAQSLALRIQRKRHPLAGLHAQPLVRRCSRIDASQQSDPAI